MNDQERLEGLIINYGMLNLKGVEAIEQINNVLKKHNNNFNPDLMEISTIIVARIFIIDKLMKQVSGGKEDKLSLESDIAIHKQICDEIAETMKEIVEFIKSNSLSAKDEFYEIYQMALRTYNTNTVVKKIINAVYEGIGKDAK